jgi:hypothetical protein
MSGENTLEQVEKSLIGTDEYGERLKCKFSVTYFDITNKSPSDDENKCFIESMLANTQKVITDAQITEYVLKMIGGKPIKVAELAIQPNVSDTVSDRTPALDADKLHQFENAFDRPMFVKEYFKYIVHPKDDIFQDLTSFKKAFTSQYNEMVGIYARYCDMDLSEHTFVDTYLFTIDDVDFYQDTITKMVLTPNYEDCMKSMLTKYYMKIYDIEMDVSDLDYIFEKVKAQKIHPGDDKLVQVLKQFKGDTDTYIDNIFTTYQLVLDREPDRYELNDELAFYRRTMQSGGDITLDDINSIQAKKLAQTLEFHDVIKKAIKTQFAAEKSAAISPSQLYAILNAVLVNIKNITIENLHEYITGCI